MKGIAHIPHHLVLFAIGLLTAFQVSAQHSCCDPSEGSATASFAALGQEDGFRAAHQTPRNFVLEDAKGANVTFLTPDGKTGGGYYVPAETDADKYLFVIHEWWGLNDHIRAEAERLQAELGDVHVLALDLYDGKVATDRQSASQYMQSVDEARAKAIIQGALNNVGAEAKVGTIGWCFGGGWSLQATLLAGSQAAGCVLYYGMPEKDVEKLKTLETDVLGIFASKDKWINAEVVAAFEANMKAAGKKVKTKTFEAAHAFANPSREIYDKEAAEEANRMTVGFLKKGFE